ncbi:hypothetical protein SC020_15480 [Legionella pneumophila serogroup 1]
MSPRLPKVIYQIFNLQLLRRYAPRNDGPKNRTVQRIFLPLYMTKKICHARAGAYLYT